MMKDIWSTFFRQQMEEISEEERIFRLKIWRMCSGMIMIVIALTIIAFTTKSDLELAAQRSVLGLTYGAMIVIIALVFEHASREVSLEKLKLRLAICGLIILAMIIHLMLI